jgi:hypothetical protein
MRHSWTGLSLRVVRRIRRDRSRPQPASGAPCQISPASSRISWWPGAKLAVRLRFRGHFTGRYNGIQGSGQDIDFVAFDIQHVGADKIVEDWHLEDDLTFLLQAGLVTVAQT